MATPIKQDIVQRGLNRLMTQWADKPVTIGLLKSYLQSIQVIEDQWFQLLEERNITDGQGVQLDNLGLLIGQSRDVIEGAYAKYFGFAGNPNSDGFNQEPFFITGDPLVVTKSLDDAQYRLYLRARAASNSSSATPEDLIKFFKALFGVNTNTIVTDTDTATATISVGHMFTDDERLLVLSSRQNGMIPKPAGVIYKVRQFSENGYFGFNADSQAKGFGVGSFISDIGQI